MMLLPLNWFPFVIPWDDASKGTATDVSFLNAAPAGKNGRIVARGGHFVEANTGRRVRFMGANLTALSAFPTHADADRIAGRLAKAGFNIVRFHHLQNGWDVERGGSIWKKGRAMIEVDPAQLDKLDYFVAALKKRGVYSNLNLQTTRDYLPEMGFPEEVRQLKDFAKRIDKVDRRMIALQKAYAKTLLDRKNPYTGLAYRDEPALAVVEINNENSLVGWPGQEPGAGLADLPPFFRKEIQTAWNGWLKKAYADDAALRRAWSQGVTPDGPSLLRADRRWTEENQSAGDVRRVDLLDAAPAEGQAPPIARDVRSNAGPNWHVQLHQTGLDLKEGDTYTVVFSASCSQPADIDVAANLDEADWHNVGLSRTIRLTPEPKTFRLTFAAHGVRKDHNRIAFAIGGARGTVTIARLELRPGLGGALLPEGASLADGTVPLFDGGTRAQRRDWTRFLAETETAYADEMRAYLRKDLGIRANLIDSQIQWGGLTALAREKGSDFVDAHMYWEHPDFPRGAWDPKDWTVRNTSMVAAMARGEAGLLDLAKHRVVGKPFTVSEYNHPAPSDYRVEMMPILASFAAAQEWDGFYVFEYGLTGTGHGNDRFNGFFDAAQDPVKAAFFPTAALIFRGALVPTPLGTQAASVPTDRPWEGVSSFGDAFRGAALDLRRIPKIGIVQGPAAPSGKPATSIWLGEFSPRKGSEFDGPGTPAIRRGDPRDFLLKPAVGGAGYTFGDGKASAMGAVGFVGGQDLDPTGRVGLGFPVAGDGFAAATVVALDHKPLEGSSRMLLTLARRAENLGMAWNEARTTVGDGWGKGPVQAEGVSCVLTIDARRALTLWALDPTGRRKAKVPGVLGRCGTRRSFRLGPQSRTLWYELAAK